MTVKEFKNALQGISEPIDRIAGFCDNYDQMFARCEIRVKWNTVVIDTSGDLFHPGKSPTVTESIARILAMPAEMDDYFVLYEGADNQADTCLKSREIRRVKVVHGTTGTGISLQGSYPNGVLNQGYYLTKLYINDERAGSLNTAFYDFVKQLDICDYMDSRDEGKGVFIDFVADGVTCGSFIALMAGTFKDVVFCCTQLASDEKEVYRLTNDYEGHYWAKHAAVYVPADDRESVTCNGDYRYYIHEMTYAKKECGTAQEAEQFITEQNPDLEVGDIAVHIVNRYIDNPLDLILKPLPGDENE